MSDPYTTQDKDYLTTTQHRAQTSASAHREESGAATPSFLSAASRTDSSASPDVNSQSASTSPSTAGAGVSSSSTPLTSATTADELSASLHPSPASSPSEYSQQQQQQLSQHERQRSLEIGRCTQPSDVVSQVSSGNISRRKSNVLITSSDLSWSAVPAINTAATETRSNLGEFGGPQGYSGSASAPLPQRPPQLTTDGISAPGLVRRGTKRRGSDTCIVLMAVGDCCGEGNNNNNNNLCDAHRQQPSASSSPSFPCAKRVYRARSTIASRKMIASNSSSPSLFADFRPSSVSAPASTVASPSTSVGFERSAALSGGSGNVPKNAAAALALTAAGSTHVRANYAGFCGGLHQTQRPLLLGAHDTRGKADNSCQRPAVATATATEAGDVGCGEAHTAAENSYKAPVSHAVSTTTAPVATSADSSVPDDSGKASATTTTTATATAHSLTDEGHAPQRAFSGSASDAHVTGGMAGTGDSKVDCAHEQRRAGGHESASQLLSSAMDVDGEEDEMPHPTARRGAIAASSNTPAMVTKRIVRSVSAPAALPPCGGTAAANGRVHIRSQKHQQQQMKHQAPSDAASAAAQASLARSQVCALPPINRYTLRELKIQNILQNPRLRHEVLFEPKLEFRPNSCGQLAEAKQRAALQYWAAVEQAVKADVGASGVATITMLIVELREILAEMAEDSPKAELAHHAVELRERLDEQRIRQQLENRVFDAAAVVTYLVAAMEHFAQASRKALVARVLVYVQRGRFVRGLRAAFDILECIKIDAANRSIEMYREYMRSTAVAFERSHFSMALRRNTIELADTTDWWRRALAESKKSGGSLEVMFREAGRELILDDGQATPGLFRMDEARIQVIRKEAERLSIVGMMFLAFVQFLQMVRRNGSSAGAAQPQQQQKLGGGTEFVNAANGRINHERLAAECLQLVPEGCTVKWTESLLATRASPAKPAGASPARASSTAARGEVGFSHLVSELVFLAERTLVRGLTGAEIAMLERTLLRTARYECPLREVVEERIAAAVRLHTDALTALAGKVQGSDWEAMPQGASDILRKAMLSFLAPALSTLSVKISSVVTHHWQVYKSFYVAVSTSAASAGKRNNGKNGGSGGSSSNDSNSSSSNGRGGASAETPSNASSSASTIHAA